MPFTPVSLDEMYKEVLAWDVYAMVEGSPMYSLRTVPILFSSIDQYLDVFEPLLLEECRAQIVRSIGELEASPERLRLLSAEDAETFRVMGFEPPPLPKNSSASPAKPTFVETDLVCVSYEPLRLTGGKAAKETEAEAETGQEFHALALVLNASTDKLNLKLYLPPERTTRLPQTQYKRLSMLRHVMVPSSGAWYVQKVGNMVTINREFQALYSMRDLNLCDELLAPGNAHTLKPPASSLRPSAELIRAIEERFDLSQLRAIRMSLTGRGITLIQGPPGTGKTKTILGILSVLLTSQDGTTARAPGPNTLPPPPPPLGDARAPTTAPLGGDGVAQLLASAAPWLRQPGTGIDGVLAAAGAPASSAVYPRATLTDRWLSLGRSEAETPPRHVMVCAPSNAAIDEIVTRILRRDSGGAGGMLDASGAPWVPLVVRVGPNVKETLLDVSLDVLAKKKAADKAGLTYDAAKMEVLNEAHIVCTTLSCAGYAMFNSLKSGFDTVLVDEAAQAVEVSSLIPLKYACRRLILVGDPKQLPATVFSDSATSHNYEQSLFQRLQRGGQQVALLTTQYRMNPSISRFPATEFYRGAVQDAAALLDMPGQPWHKRRVLAPYVFFDVADGRATESNSSWINELEAQLAISIVKLLLTEYEGSISTNSIGIISPYNAQVRHIRRAIAEMLGAEKAAEIEVNSVDGFQGREKAVILFSTVRSDYARDYALGIGFVKDERRINVSMTRAQHSLLILGHAKTLRETPIWAKLLDDATERKCLMKATSPLSIWFESASKQMVSLDDVGEPRTVVKASVGDDATSEVAPATGAAKTGAAKSSASGKSARRTRR